jgi:hypothetical protein
MTTTVTIFGERAAAFERVFGTAKVPVLSFLPELAALPGFDEPQPVYLIDLTWVVREGHRGALVGFLAGRFGLPRELVDADLELYGMPILAADCVVSTDTRDFL